MSQQSARRSRANVLVVDDEPSARKGLEWLLVQEGYAVSVASNGREALEVADHVPPDIVVTDLKMPEMDGLVLLKRLRERDRDLPVIVVTAFGDPASAVAAMRAGAADYVVKPVDIEALSLTIERALEQGELRIEAEDLRRQVREQEGSGLANMVGGSPAMRRVYRNALRVAPSRATVLITGESGTGKGELAKAIHRRSPRADRPFVAVQCSALSESLLESELFGHERGSFTGADKKRIGRFEQADSGTLFLDEVGELSPATQVKLLRVLQERSFERVGGNEPVSVDVRLLAATNRDLVADVQSGRFREDLFYRLNVVQIEMPPLRVREGDVMLLARHFMRRFAAENHKRVDDLSDGARTKLVSYRWPGNVRELENAIERAVVLCDSNAIDADLLALGPADRSASGPPIPGSTFDAIERFAILSTLEVVGGSTSKAAEMLDISTRTIQYRMHEYGLAGKR